MSEIMPLLSYYMQIYCKWRQSLTGPLLKATYTLEPPDEQEETLFGTGFKLCGDNLNLKTLMCWQLRVKFMVHAHRIVKATEYCV